MAWIDDQLESYESAHAASERMNDLVAAIRKRLKTLDPDDPVALTLQEGVDDLRHIQRAFNNMTNAAWGDIERGRP